MWCKRGKVQCVSVWVTALSRTCRWSRRTKSRDHVYNTRAAYFHDHLQFERIYSRVAGSVAHGLVVAVASDHTDLFLSTADSL
jgi:hypothetical protein